MKPDIFFLPALELGRMLRDKEITSVELTEGFLGRIEEIDPEINAFVTVTSEIARESAKAADARLSSGNPRSRFDGVPVAIKDLSLTKGVRTTLGSRAFEQFVPPISHHYVEAILDSGMVMLGKTNSSEFGAFPTGENALGPPTRNPWDRNRITGGSSAGSAAAVAAGLAPIAEGSDGGGSIRIPSSACGTVGIKPSRGRVSHGPLMGETPGGLSTSGVIAKTVDDAAALLDRMSVRVGGDYAPAPLPETSFHEHAGRDPVPLRIGFLTKDTLGEPQPDVMNQLRSFAEDLTGLGHSVEEFTSDAPDVSVPFLILWQVTMASIPVSDLDLLDHTVRPLVESGRSITAVQLVSALNELNMWVRANIAPLFRRFDVVLSPIVSSSPPELGWLREDFATTLARSAEWMHWCPPVNIAGLPAVALPAGQTPDGLPVGAQLIGDMWSEPLLIQLAAQVERAKGGLFRRPPV